MCLVKASGPKLNDMRYSVTDHWLQMAWYRARLDSVMSFTHFDLYTNVTFRIHTG